MSENRLILGDCLEKLKELPDNSVDCVITDPPYGISFMGKNWDKALPSTDVWKECLRVLKDGAFAFVMSIPRQDCQSRMIIDLENSGFTVNFTPIYWAFASGFPKAMNISKKVDAKLGGEREVIERNPNSRENCDKTNTIYESGTVGKTDYITKPATDQAKALNGSYGGFQPKPAVEVILVAMKPLSEKTYVEQALKNEHGITWLDNCRIPYESENDKESARWGNDFNAGKTLYEGGFTSQGKNIIASYVGRFPANLLVSDDILNDGRITKAGNYKGEGSKSGGIWSESTGKPAGREYGDSGSFSRYFSLDAWAEKNLKELPQEVQKIYPFIYCPKASKSEKNKGLDEFEKKQTNDGRNKLPDNAFQRGQTFRRNSHPTVKPLKLMAYLTTLGTKEKQTVLDPFMGSGTTGVACQQLNRNFIGIELNEEYFEIAKARMDSESKQSRFAVEPTTNPTQKDWEKKKEAKA